MSFQPYGSGCGSFLTSNDRHDRCLTCLGRKHTEEQGRPEDYCLERPPAESEAELVAMLLRAAKSIERSRLDDWFLGAGSDVPPRSIPVPFFPEEHELTKTWRAPYMALLHPHHSGWWGSQGVRGHSPGGVCSCSALVPAKRYHLEETSPVSCKACKLSSALAAKAYSAVSQAASALHAMAILQVHQAKALKELHQVGPGPRLMQELHTANDFALRATKVTAWSLGQVMSTMVVQEHHLLLNLAQMSDADKVRFLDTPISQAGLFSDTFEDFAQQFSAVQKQAEAIKHIWPRHESTKPPVPDLRLLVAVGAPLQPLHLLHLLRHPKRQLLSRGIELVAGERRSPLLRAPLRTPTTP
ncbi:Dihydroxy-acid dehydratase [Labeo rohita]|uniref:Dihydroxy-acid dehydratase n=1 Tax=Labeo rohita TaxID=84645 RepID=A0ABQ8MI54_LABRO|nr:Dihydroxy-acid dehydratase [Labeo rohita]